MAKKKDEHHGGAWKVAYADFVTAMMALVIVLWICKEKPKLAQMIAATFHKPLIKMAGGEEENAGVQIGPDEDIVKEDQIEDKLDEIATQMQKLLNVDDADENKPIDLEISGENLKLTLYDRANKPLFEKDSAKPTKWGNFVFEGMAWLIMKYKMSVFIDGHTAASKNEDKAAEYGLWELSIDRANACRRAMMNSAMEPKYIFRVTGFGGTRPMPEVDAEDASNNRVVVTLNLSKIDRGTKPEEAPKK
jgi:chemotaxis protein MotB